MSEQNMTVIASELARRNGINVENLIGTGQNGRVLKSDVELAIALAANVNGEENRTEEAVDETEAIEGQVIEVEQEAVEKQKVEADATVEVSVTPLALPVADRMVLMMIERRTGLPIRQHVKLHGSEPYYLTDSIIPVVAVRNEKVRRVSGASQTFNPVLPADVFEELFGRANAGHNDPSADFNHRIGIYSFDGAAQDRLRFSRGLDDEFGRNDLERAIRHWAMGALANPNMTEGTYNLRADNKGDHIRPEKEEDMTKAVERMFSKPKSINRALDVPPMGTIGMDRYTGGDEHFGQAFFELGNKFLKKSEGLDKGFQDYRIYGIFTVSDQRMAETKGGQAAADYAKVVDGQTVNGALIPVANFRDMILGKFLSGIQRFTPATMHGIREFLRGADTMHARNASDAELASESVRAVQALYDVSGQHILDTLEPKFLADACRLAGRRMNAQIDPEGFVQLAVHFDGEGNVIQDRRFSMNHARDVVEGKHPMQAKLNPTVKMVCGFARDWHQSAVQDCTAALSGLKSYYCSRTPDRKQVMVYMVPMTLSKMNKTVQGMEVRPSFFLIQGPPVQVLNASAGSKIPATLDGFFKKK